MRIFIYNFNNVLDALVDEVRLRGDLAQNWMEADTVVVWQDAVGVLADITRDARASKKRVIVAEHGLLSINDYIPPLSKPLLGNIFMAWGEKTREWLVGTAGWTKDKIVITGTTIFDYLGPKQEHKGKNVLFAPRHWEPEMQENLETAKLLKTYENAYVYSKIIAGEHNPDNYPNPILSVRTNKNHLKTCYDALKVADVVVGIGEGTFAALAYWMDIPYISVDNWRTKELLGKVYNSEEFNSQISCACKHVRIQKLLETIDYELEHPESMFELRSAFVQDYLDGGDPKRALKKQLKVIYG